MKLKQTSRGICWEGNRKWAVAGRGIQGREGLCWALNRQDKRIMCSLVD